MENTVRTYKVGAITGEEVNIIIESLDRQAKLKGKLALHMVDIDVIETAKKYRAEQKHIEELKHHYQSLLSN